jgi:hypothetical protein
MLLHDIKNSAWCENCHRTAASSQQQQQQQQHFNDADISSHGSGGDEDDMTFGWRRGPGSGPTAGPLGPVEGQAVDRYLRRPGFRPPNGRDERIEQPPPYLQHIYRPETMGCVWKQAGPRFFSSDKVT